jgi:hypothetical protein
MVLHSFHTGMNNPYPEETPEEETYLSQACHEC